MRNVVALFLALCNLTACYKNHLYVQQEKVDRNFLASTYVSTPDPRQEHPPEGQRLLIAWDFPITLFREGLSLATTVRLWDQTQQTFTLPIDRKRGSTAYFFPSSDLNKKILTYRVQVVSKGQIIETWEHHFWTEFIDVDKLNGLSYK